MVKYINYNRINQGEIDNIFKKLKVTEPKIKIPPRVILNIDSWDVIKRYDEQEPVITGFKANTSTTYTDPEEINKAVEQNNIIEYIRVEATKHLLLFIDANNDKERDVINEKLAESIGNILFENNYDVTKELESEILLEYETSYQVSGHPTISMWSPLYAGMGIKNKERVHKNYVIIHKDYTTEMVYETFIRDKN